MGLEDEVRKEDDDFVISEKTELGEVMSNLDNDVPDSRGLSAIDFNTRLDPISVKAMSTVDELVKMGILPKSVKITQQIKRLNVSLGGQGREEKVRIVSGQRDHQQGGGFLGGMKRLFSRREE